MAKRSLWLIIGAVIIIAVIIIGLRLIQKPTLKEKVIKIGVILNLTGPLSIADEPKKLVLEAAIEFLKKNASLHDPINKIQLVFEDSRTDPKAGITAFNKLYNEGIRIFVTGTSFNAMSLLPLTEEKHCLLLAVSGHPDFTKNSHYAVRLYPNVEIGSKLMAKVLEIEKVGNIYILHTNEPFGKSYAEELKKQFKGKVVGEEEFDIAQIDFKNILIKIRKINPDRIVVIGFGIAEQNLIRQIIEAHMHIPIFGCEAFYYAISAVKTKIDLKNYLGLKKTIFLAPTYIRELSSPQGNPFINFYKLKHNGDEPQIFGVFAADGISLIRSALERTPSTEIEDIRKTLFALRNISVFSGQVSVLPNGDIEYPLTVMRFDEKANIIEYDKLQWR